MHLSFNRKIRSKSTKQQIFSIRFDPPNVWGWSATSKTSTWCKKCLLGDGPVINRRISVAGWIHMICLFTSWIAMISFKGASPIFWTCILAADCVGDSSMLSLEGKCVHSNLYGGYPNWHGTPKNHWVFGPSYVQFIISFQGHPTYDHLGPHAIWQ